MNRVLIFCLVIFSIGCKNDVNNKNTTVPVEKAPVERPKVETTTKIDSNVVKVVPPSTPEIKKAVVVEKEKPKSTIPKKVKPKKILPAKKVPQARPAIIFEDIRHDFDTLMQGEKYTHQFKFKNTGNQDLEIFKAKGSCGCTQPSFPFIGIAPGETGFIGVEYNSVGKELDQSATIEVFTNVQEPPYVLYLTGHVKAPLKEEEKPEKEMEKDSIGQE